MQLRNYAYQIMSNTNIAEDEYGIFNKTQRIGSDFDKKVRWGLDKE